MNEDKLKQLVLFQFFALIINMVASITISIYAADYFKLENSFLEIILVLIASWVSFKILNIVGIMIMCVVLYRGNAQQMELDIRSFHGGEAKELPEDTQEEKPSVKKLEWTVISTAEKPLGKYMDADFFEWIELQDENSLSIRFEFDGTADMKIGAANLRSDQILIEPGILYKRSST